MMKKWQSIRTKMLVLLGGAALVATLGSCADGYDSPDGFDAGVKNTTMVTPNQIFIYLNQAGTEATIQWEMVKGCSGHEVTLLNTDDPENPVVVDGYDKRIVDGSRMTVPVQEDSHYKITMRTLGNKDLGNKDAENTLEKEFVTGVPSLGTIAGGTEEAPVNLNEWWTANQPENTKGEWAFDLEAGKYYEITDTLDLSIHWLTFRGNKADRPIVFMKGNGTITSCSGMKLKYINFDCTESSADGVIGMTKKENCPDSILSENLGYARVDGTTSTPITGIYIVQDPWYVAHCWFKNVPRGFICANSVESAWWYFTIDDCIIQLDNEKSSKPFMALRPGGRTIKNISITNSTIYNIKENNTSTYFVQWANRTNAAAAKVFGNTTAEMNTQTFNIAGTTFCRIYSGSNTKFGNDVSYSVLTIERTIFNDCYGVRQLPRWCSNKTYKFNFWWDSEYNSGSGYDTQDLQQKDSGGAEMVAVYDFGWTPEQMSAPLVFKTPSGEMTVNGGVDFTPKENEVLKYSGGDPRWLKQ